MMVYSQNYRLARAGHLLKTANSRGTSGWCPGTQWCEVIVLRYHFFSFLRECLSLCTNLSVEEPQMARFSLPESPSCNSVLTANSWVCLIQCPGLSVGLPMGKPDISLSWPWWRYLLFMWVGLNSQETKKKPLSFTSHIGSHITWEASFLWICLSTLQEE